LQRYWLELGKEERPVYIYLPEITCDSYWMVSYRKIDYVGNVRWGKEESMEQECDKCIVPVNTFYKPTDTDTRSDIRIKWMLARMAYKCKLECAEFLWRKQLITMEQVMALVHEWECQKGLRNLDSIFRIRNL